MTATPRAVLSWAIAALLACPLLPAFAESDSTQLRAQASSAKSDLDLVSREIRTMSQKLKLTEEERNKQIDALRDAEQQIDTLHQTISEASREQAKRRIQLSQLYARQRALREDRKAQISQLRQEVSQAYRTGRADYFKLLLNQQNPELLARQLRYYGYIQQARGRQVASLDQTMTELVRIQNEQAAQIQKLAEVEDDLVRQRSSLKVATYKREAALDALNSEIQQQGRNLDALRRDQAALQSLMRRLEQTARDADRKESQRRKREQEKAREAERLEAQRRKREQELAREAERQEAVRRKREEQMAREIKAQTDARLRQEKERERELERARERDAKRERDKELAELKAQEREREREKRREAAQAQREAREESQWSDEPDYKPQRGGCTLPVAGGLRAQYGASRGGGLRWNGIVIGAAEGAPVKAVKGGKVLYADFLRGYGKLVIIDHGGGLMSLYGFNQSLSVGVKDSVSAGQTIASVGAADGDSEPGLYFEARRRGRPIQPAGWCNR